MNQDPTPSTHYSASLLVSTSVGFKHTMLRQQQLVHLGYKHKVVVYVCTATVPHTN